MNFTNMLFLLTVASTNKVAVPGEWLRSVGTNYSLMREVVSTNVYAVTVQLCTNRVNVSHSDSGTNGPAKWEAVTMVPVVPGRL